jgi:hypothetical protein
MRKAKIVCLMSLLIITNSYIYSQQIDSSVKPRTKISLHSITQAGAIIGEKDDFDLSLQVINGVSFKNWFAGIGAGVDDYEYRSIPLFLDVRRNFERKQTNFFVYADGGISFPWAHKEEKQFSNYVFKRGLYADAGIGYSFKIGKANALMVSGGYSVKKLKKGKTDFYFMNGQTIFEKPNLYYYEFKRILFKVGFQF